VNDRAVSLLENYEIEVLKTRKGRGAIICETNQGEYIFKEYFGMTEKLMFQNQLLHQMKEKCPVMTEEMIPTKEGELYVTDGDGIHYILKTNFNGRECNIKDMGEIKSAISTLATLHESMVVDKEENELPYCDLSKEYEKHNKELRRVRNFLKKKSQKTEFERYLTSHYDYFLEQAEEVQKQWSEYAFLPEDEEKITICHGDYQYHNIIRMNEKTAVINFEKWVADDPIRDLYFFLRKILEKNNWNVNLGDSLLEAYSKERPIGARSHVNLYYRFAYPEKFWKIVNFYYNSRKAWIPEKNIEKLQKVVEQEKEKQGFLDAIFRKI